MVSGSGYETNGHLLVCFFVGGAYSSASSVLQVMHRICQVDVLVYKDPIL